MRQDELWAFNSFPAANHNMFGRNVPPPAPAQYRVAIDRVRTPALYMSSAASIACLAAFRKRSRPLHLL
jgi:hypothetical protein